MPDTPAQHDTRSWFEEPPRTDDPVADSGDKRTSGTTPDSAATEDPQSGSEHSANGRADQLTELPIGGPVDDAATAPDELSVPGAAALDVEPNQDLAFRPRMDDATTVSIPVVPAQAELNRPSGPPPDSAPTTEIPRIHQRTVVSPGWPAADVAQPRFGRPQHHFGTEPPLPPDPPDVPVFGHNPGFEPSGPGDDRARLLRRAGILAGAVLGLLMLVYGIDVALSRGDVPRGVSVASVSVGGLDRPAAEQRLRQQIEPRLIRPVAIRAGDVDATLDPRQAGLTLDWPATLDQAGTQPLNPWTRLVSLFTTREVGVVTNSDRQRLTSALEALRPTTDRDPVEGNIRFQGAKPLPVDPVVGQRLNVPAATDAVLADWAGGGVVEVPVATQPVSTTPEGLRATVHDLVEPAVSGPVTITGEGGEAVLKPQVTARALRFTPDGHGGLTVTIDNSTVIGAVGPQLAKTEQQGKDATIAIQDGHPAVQPSADGHTIDWDKSLLPLPDVLRAAGSGRTLPAVYVNKPAKLTTDQANQLGITTVIGTFSTGGFAKDSGQNIHRVADQVNGAIVAPGETFSLNGYTGPRTAATGYVEAGIIDHGRPGRGIGGGISQFATTLYNASYFAGMTNVAHKEHSFYISRYPAGREATVFEGAIDLKFRNDYPTGILIQTAWTPSTITVTIWGTKHVNVESITGPRTNPTEPPTQTIHEQSCSPTNGIPGFTVTDTRVIRDANSGAEIKRETRKVVYEPEPKVICAP